MNNSNRAMLLPLSWIYSLASVIRNKLYDKGIFKSVKVGVPVISIGNITAGGTGKTPLTIFIASYYLKNNFNVGIISRGYGRLLDEMVVVYDGDKIVTDPRSAGDELIEISHRLKEIYPNFVVIADSDRIRAANFMIKNYKPDVIILDDAFQHRRIKRDLDVVIVDKNSDDHLDKRYLPAGNLRESFENKKRANVLVDNYKFSEIPEYQKTTHRHEFTSSYNTNATELLNKIGSGKAVAVFGIAKPESFIETLKKLNIGLKKRFTFDDHHMYTKEEIEEIKQSCEPGDVILTTGKDMVKLDLFRDIFKDTQLIPVNISVSIKDKESEFYRILDKVLAK